MSFLTHYPGAIPGKKRKLSLTDEEKQKKVKEYEKNRPDRKFSTKCQTDRPWLHYDGEKMSCKTCVEFFKNDKDCKNPFLLVQQTSELQLLLTMNGLMYIPSLQM